MGAYVNPPAGEDKEKWLRENGVVTPVKETEWNFMPGSLFVCLMNNGPFKAAGICYSSVRWTPLKTPRIRDLRHGFWSQLRS
jgi:hypothetical protein